MIPLMIPLDPTSQEFHHNISSVSSSFHFTARNASTRAKFRYWSFLLMATVTCIVLLVPGLRQIIFKIPNFCNKVKVLCWFVVTGKGFHYSCIIMNLKLLRGLGMNDSNLGIWMSGKSILGSSLWPISSFILI